MIRNTLFFMTAIGTSTILAPSASAQSVEQVIAIRCNTAGDITIIYKEDGTAESINNPELSVIPNPEGFILQTDGEWAGAAYTFTNFLRFSDGAWTFSGALPDMAIFETCEDYSDHVQGAQSIILKSSDGASIQGFSNELTEEQEGKSILDDLLPPTE